MMRCLGVLLLAPSIAALQAAIYLPRMPARMASHFDGAGAANGWSSRGTFFLVSTGTILLLSLLFWGITAGLHRIPRSLVSLPKKDFWFAPERSEATYAALRRLFFWFALATQAFLLGIFQLTILANSTPERHLPQGPFWISFTAYLVFAAGWTILFYWRFGRTGESEGRKSRQSTVDGRR